MAKNEHSRALLDKFIDNHPEMEKKEVIKANLNLDVHVSSLYRWYDHKQKTGSTARIIASGRPAKIATKRNIRRIANFFNHRSGRSQKNCAGRLGCHRTWIGRILKKHTAIRCRKKIKQAYQTAIQRQTTRPKCRRLLQANRENDFIIDDESYFTLSNSTLAGNSHFYSDNVDLTPDDVKHRYVQKFEPKVLVWLAISPRGVSKPYFKPSGLSITSQVYLEIIKSHLEPFIARHYRDGGYVFWPDLAGAHYGNIVLDYLKSQNIQFVPKIDNPASLPKARPIEDFWGNLKAAVYANNWQARNVTQLEDRIRSCLRKMDLSLVQAHASSVHRRLDQIRRGINI